MATRERKRISGLADGAGLIWSMVGDRGAGAGAGCFCLQIHDAAAIAMSGSAAGWVTLRRFGYMGRGDYLRDCVFRGRAARLRLAAACSRRICETGTWTTRPLR